MCGRVGEGRGEGGGGARGKFKNCQAKKKSNKKKQKSVWGKNIVCPSTFQTVWGNCSPPPL